MRVDGFWLLCDDGITRPVVRSDVQAADGTRIRTKFLVDSGADRTVLSEDLFRELGLSPITSELHLEGVGGRTDSVIVETCIRLDRDNHLPISIRGPFAAFTDQATLDMCVLGRDITNLFSLIVDKPQDIVCLLGAGHRYTITAE
jgi:hypothetical protein